MTSILVALHLMASGLALLAGSLALVSSGRGARSVLGWIGMIYVGSVGVMSATALGLFRETGGVHALHGVAIVSLILVVPAGCTMIRYPGAAAIVLNHRGTLSGTYLVLLVSAVLETARRLVAPLLAASGFEAWEAYWGGVGLLAAAMAVLGLRLTRKPGDGNIGDTHGSQGDAEVRGRQRR